jgi:guanylate kinase
MKKGFVVIISGPSGVGKGTIIRKVRKKIPKLGLAISATTRSPRPHEEDGLSYHFLSNDEFETNINKNCFLEWCNVHQHKYGTLKSEVDQFVDKDKNIIVEIDIQGALKIKQSEYNTLSIFITPPKFQDLVDRLKNRNTETDDVIQKRLTIAGNELDAIGKYDYIVVNDDIDNAVKDIFHIINSLDENHL